MIDKTIFFSLLLFGLTGLLRGAIKEFFSVAGVVLAVLGARFLNRPLGSLLCEALDLDPMMARTLASFALFVGIGAFATALSRFLTKLMKKTGLGGVNRLLGGAFGCLKAGAVAAVILLLIDALPPGILSDRIWRELNTSVAYRLVHEKGPVFIGYLPRAISQLSEMDITRQFLSSLATFSGENNGQLSDMDQENIENSPNEKGKSGGQGGATTGEKGKSGAQSGVVAGEKGQSGDDQIGSIIRKVQSMPSFESVVGDQELMGQINQGNWDKVFENPMVQGLLSSDIFKNYLKNYENSLQNK